MTEDNNQNDLTAYAQRVHSRHESSRRSRPESSEQRVDRLITLYCKANKISISDYFRSRIAKEVARSLICREWFSEENCIDIEADEHILSSIGWYIDRGL